jgi:phenylalanyl-tRNA synthetase beta chain
VVSRSPDWLRFRLIACGLRPRNLLVDLSNYVMLELGQPTHPFDRDALAGGRIVVRGARPGETLTTLDGVARALTAQDCVIADGERAVALAGIMGGSETEVSDGTRQVFLESAAFDPIACGAARAGWACGRTRSRASRRGSIPRSCRPRCGATRCCCGGLRPSAVVAQHLPADGRRGGAGDDDRAERRAAAAASGRRDPRHGDPGASGVDRLHGARDGRALRGRRAELALDQGRHDPEDLIEEVGRLAGYDRVPARQPVGPLRLGRTDALPAIEDRTRDALVAQAFMEVVSYSMVPDAVLATAGWPESVALPRLANPLQSDAARLRPSVAPGLLARLEGWLRHADEVSAFEVGRGYAVGAAGPSGPVEERREAVALLAWREPRDARDVVRALRAVAEETWGRLELPRTPVLSPWTPDAEAPWFHPRRSASLAAEAGGEPLAWLGAVSPNILAAFDVRGSAGLLRLDLARCVALAGGGARFRPIPRFPPVRIDLAFALPYSLPTEDVRAGIRAAGGKLLRGVEGFDVYRGAPLGADERSVAFHLVFQADDRTLTDAEVERVRGRIIEAAQALGAKLR